jgi:hypothetical protein
MRLTKVQKADLDRVRKVLDDKKTLLLDAKAGLEAFVEERLQGINALVDEYNSALADAETVVEGIGGDLRADWDDKSEKWQDSDAGQDANSFIEAFENVDFSEVSEVRMLDIELDPDPEDHASALEDLPEEAG